MKTIEEMVAEAERRGVSYGKLMEQLYAEQCARRRHKPKNHIAAALTKPKP